MGFKDWGVNTVIRLNKSTCYDRTKFEREGIRHRDLYFSDGGLPPPEHVHEFLNLVESETGGVAVHCKAGLGRTGTLIGAYVMKHYKMPAKMFIAWNRLARPGSILGPQQRYLCDIEAQMFSMPSNFPKVLQYTPAAPGSGEVGGTIKMVANNNHMNMNNTSGSSMFNTPTLPRPSSTTGLQTPKSFYGTNSNQTSPAISHSGQNLHQQGQGEWLLNQKNRKQGHKTTSGNGQSSRPGNYTVI